MSSNVLTEKRITLEESNNKLGAFDSIISAWQESESTGSNAYEYHDNKVLRAWAEQQPDYKENQQYYDAYLDEDLEMRAMIDSGISSGRVSFDKEGKPNVFGFQQDKFRGGRLFSNYAKEQRDADFGTSLKSDIEKYEKTYKTTMGEVGSFIGHVAHWISEPTSWIELATPGKMVTKGLLKKGASEVVKTGAKAFGVEAAAATVAESIKWFSPYGKEAAYDRAGLKTNAVSEILFNATLAGVIRGTGSMIVDARTLMKAKNIPLDQLNMLKRFDDEIAASLVRSKDVNIAIKQELDKQLTRAAIRQEFDKPFNFEADVDINTKTDPNIAAVDIQQTFDDVLEETGDNVVLKDIGDAVDTAKVFDPEGEDLFTQNTLAGDLGEYVDDIEIQNLDKEIEELEAQLAGKPVETPTFKPEAARRHPTISYTHEDGREVNLTKGEYNTLKAYQKNVRAGKTPTKKQIDTQLKHEKFYDENEDMFAKESTFDTYAKQQEGDKYADMSAEDLAELERQGKVAPTDLQDPNTLFAKFADNLAAGTVAGIEEDEEGNITFDPVKFVAGLGGYTAAKEILKAGAKHPKIVGKVNEWLDDIHEEVARAAGGGTPPGVKVAYHATKAKFDTKDIKPSSTGNLGSAIYFSFDKEYVSKYGENLHEVGLDRANILDLSDREVVDPLYKEWLGVEDIKSVKKDYNHYMQQIMSKGETVSDVANSQNDFNTFLASKGYDGTTVKRPGQTGSEIAIFNLDSIDFKKGLLERKSLDILKEENKATLPKIRTNKIFLNDVGVMPKEINQDLNKIIDTPKEAELPFETVKLSDIVPTQKNVTVPNLEKVKGVTDVAEDIIVAEVDGKYYVVDGHHRISNNILEGEEVVEAKVYRKVDDRKPLKVRLSGDNLLEAEDLIEDLQDVNAKIDDKGYVTLYHRTSKEAADKIVKSKKMTSKEPGLFFSTAKEGQAEGYGEAVIKVEVPVEDIHLDDIFSNEAHVTIEHKRFTKEAKDISKYNPVKETK